MFKLTVGAQRRWVLVAWAGLLLACGGLDFSIPALEDATHAEAAAAGWTLPEGASHIYTHDFSLPDLGSTHLRYVLSEASFDGLIADYRQRTQYTELSSWEVPSFWPDFSGFGPEAVPPAWWQPPGSFVFRSTDSGSAIGSGRQVVFDASTRTVYIWQWQREHWTMPETAAAEPLVIQLEDGLNAVDVELRCATGHQLRQRLRSGQAVFADVPVDTDCRVTLRGGEPATAALPAGRKVICRAEGKRMVCSSH